jgi:VWFA-related protein
VRTSIHDMLSQFAQAKTPVSVFVMTPQLVQIHSFTQAPQDAMKAVDTYFRRRGPKLANEVVLKKRDDEYESAAYPQDMLDVQLVDTRIQAEAITQLAEAFRHLPGRKKLLWVSTTFFGDGGGEDLLARVGAGINTFPRSEGIFRMFHAAERRETAWKQLSDANFSVYPLDANGVTNPSFDELFSPDRNGGANYGAVSGERRSSRVGMHHTLSMIEVARKTGGKNCTDLPVRCAKKVQEDGNHYYVLGFYLPKDAAVGWHRIKVDTRQSNVAIRNREGFAVQAIPLPEKRLPLQTVSAVVNRSPDNTTDEALSSDVLAALAAPADYTGVPLRLTWRSSGSGDGARRVELLISSPPGGVSLSATQSLNVDCLAYVRESGNARGTSFPESLVKTLSPPEQHRLTSSGFAYRKVLHLPPGRHGVRVFVRDNTTGKIGTVSAMMLLR